MSMMFPADLAEVIGSCLPVTPGRCRVVVVGHAVTA
jgi:hypothetical protein